MGAGTTPGGGGTIPQLRRYPNSGTSVLAVGTRFCPPARRASKKPWTRSSVRSPATIPASDIHRLSWPISTTWVTTEWCVKPRLASSAPYPSANGARGPPLHTQETLLIVSSLARAPRPSRRTDSTRRDYPDLAGAVTHERPDPTSPLLPRHGTCRDYPGVGISRRSREWPGRAQSDGRSHRGSRGSRSPGAG